jgi:FMN phosphatase YigB (HAD superfamily)
MQKRDTILFDLDGTLLRIDFDDFLKRYFKALTGEFTDLAEPELFIKVLMKSTQDMIENDGILTNEGAFMNSFFSMIEVEDIEAIKTRFDSFYKDKFPLLGEDVKPSAKVLEMVRLFKELGYTMAITTNPLFPREAILERVRWAGLNPDDFVMVTSYEEMHYAKPNLAYFQEAIDKLGRKPESCILVGNDLQEDIVAGRLGIKTFLVEDYLIDRGTEEEIIPDWRGSLEDFVDYIKENF